jgi:hypothetical protein
MGFAFASICHGDLQLLRFVPVTENHSSISSGIEAHDLNKIGSTGHGTLFYWRRGANIFGTISSFSLAKVSSVWAKYMYLEAVLLESWTANVPSLLLNR